MLKILAFLIQFINDTHLDDNIEMICEPNTENPEVIIIRRVKSENEDDY